MTSTKRFGPMHYYGGVLALSALAFLVFLFAIGGGRPSGPALFLALAVLCLGVVVHLLYRAAQALVQGEGEGAVLRASGVRRKELEREYQALKRALKELELDHAMGKLSDGDYGEIRTRYRERAVRVLRQLDQGESYQKQIEQDLRARREALGLRAEPDDQRERVRERERPAPVDPAGASPTPTCAACKAHNDADAAFCKRCGARLGAGQPEREVP